MPEAPLCRSAAGTGRVVLSAEHGGGDQDIHGVEGQQRDGHGGHEAHEIGDAVEGDEGDARTDGNGGEPGKSDGADEFAAAGGQDEVGQEPHLGGAEHAAVGGGGSGGVHDGGPAGNRG